MLPLLFGSMTLASQLKNISENMNPQGRSHEDHIENLENKQEIDKGNKNIIKIFKGLGFDTEISRLDYLHRHMNEIPRIVVLGKFNQGKSSLLNALIGSSIFDVSDKRETIEVKGHEHNGAMWIDTPGLDADEEDDSKAELAALEIADAIFFVHDVSSGELDKITNDRLINIYKNSNNKKNIFLILTKICQKDESELEKIMEKIRVQARSIPIFSVSSSRYEQGKSQGKNGLVNASGFSKLFDEVEIIKSGVFDARRSESNKIAGTLKKEVEKQSTNSINELDTNEKEIKKMMKSFSKKLNELKMQIMCKMGEV